MVNSFPRIEFECHEWEARKRMMEKRNVGGALKIEKPINLIQESDQPKSINTVNTTALGKRDSNAFMGKILDDSVCSFIANEVKRTKTTN